jgi:2-keto-4-pentenoate hydratase
MTEMTESASIIKTIFGLREGSKQVPYAELNQNISLIEAYKFVKSFLEGNNQKVAAWKLGGTNKKTQDAFNVGEAYYGPIFASELSTVMGVQGVMPDLRLLKGEAELAVRLTSFGADERNADSNDPGLIFDQWAVAIEFPYSVFSDLPSAGVAALVVDRCAAGALMLGPSQEGLPPEEFCVTIDVNGEQESSGTQDAMLLHPIDAALEFRALAFEHGFELNASQWISTGGLTSCLRMNRGDVVTLKYDGQLVYRLDNK